MDDDDVCLFGDCFGFCMQEFPLKSNNDQQMEDGQEQKNQTKQKHQPKAPKSSTMFYFRNDNSTHSRDEQRVPKRGNVCIESGQLNNKK